MKAKLKVLVPFTDKNDRTVRYKEGDTVSFDDIELDGITTLADFDATGDDPSRRDQLDRRRVAFVTPKNAAPAAPQPEAPPCARTKKPITCLSACA